MPGNIDAGSEVQWHFAYWPRIMIHPTPLRTSLAICLCSLLFCASCSDNHSPPITNWQLQELVSEAQKAESDSDLRNRYAIAATKYQQAVGHGSGKAMVALGRMYLYGQGIQKNHRKAWQCFRKAEDAGTPDASFYLFLSYAGGYGVSKNRAVAYALLKEFSEHRLEHMSLSSRAMHYLQKSLPETLHALEASLSPEETVAARSLSVRIHNAEKVTFVIDDYLEHEDKSVTLRNLFRPSWYKRKFSS